MSKDLFSELTDAHCQILFEFLIHAIESNSGIGFRAYDQGHPDYADGARQVKPPQFADDESKNLLFHMMRDLSLRLADTDPTIIHTKYGLTTWPAFCQKAKDSYYSHGKSSFIPLYLRPRE